MRVSIVTGQYCPLHQVFFVSSLQEWLPYSPVHLARAFGDAMQVVDAPCPRCLARTPTRQAQASAGVSPEVTRAEASESGPRRDSAQVLVRSPPDSTPRAAAHPTSTAPYALATAHDT
jgi:hypothetical protein